MDWNQINFEASFGRADQLPVSDLPEIVFSGRSNVGKSSLINKLFNRKSLARIGKTPGKTITVNFFRTKHACFADLPGYGYAKLSFGEKERFAGLMEHFFQSGRKIVLVIQLLDMRHPPSEDDRMMLSFLKETGIRFLIALTKSDKLNQSERAARLAGFEKELSDYGAPVTIPFSAQNGEGVTQLREAIENCNL